MIFFYLKTAIRSIGRKRVFSGLNTAGLAIGICIFLFALEFYSFEKGFNAFHANLPQLYRVNIHSSDGRSTSTFPALAPFMEGAIPGVRKAIRFGDNFNAGAVISYISNGSTDKVRTFKEDGVVFVDPAFLDAFSFPLLYGQNELSRTNTVVITATIARKIFGTEQVVGKVVKLHNQFGNLPITVVGVVKDIPSQSDIKFDYLLSMEILNNPGYTEGSNWARPDNWGNQAYTTYVWLDGHSNPEKIAAQASALWKRHDPDYKKEKGVIELQPVSEIHLGHGLSDENPTYGSFGMTELILGLGVLVLCLAWINYINFSTAFALSQARSIGIHKIIGSGKTEIVVRYLLEAFMLNLAGVALALVLLVGLQPVFNYLTGRPLALSVITSFSTLVYGTMAILAGILLCGGYVGLMLSRFKPISMIRLSDNGNPGAGYLRKGLVIFQFGVSALFITSTIIAFKQIDFLRRHDLGMNIDKLVVINGPAVKDSTYKINRELFKQELARLPFVERMSMTGSVPGVGFAHNFGADGVTGENARKGDERKSYFVSEVDEHYFDTYGIPIVKGSNFTASDANLSFKGNRLIVNETAARELGYDPATAVGKIVHWDKPFFIAGVAKDYNHRSLKEKIEPIIYVPQHNTAEYTLSLNQQGLASKLATIQVLYQRMYPGNPFEYKILRDTYNALYDDEQRTVNIALTISVLVVAIACLGLIGLSVFTAKRRVKEIGIRKILGAGTVSLFALLSAEFLWLVVIAYVVAIPVTWIFMNKWLESFAYRVSISGWIFLTSGVICLLIALVTVSFQSLRAAYVNPVKSLRSE